jgi:RimJ/RimL family protein N-acetyltransferase
MEECFPIAMELGIEKLTAYMTADQAAAIALFEELGFRPEAVLSEHVQDRDGTKFDVVMLSHDVNKFLARLHIFGGDTSA